MRKNEFEKNQNENQEKENTFEKIYNLVRKIPKGKVGTYGQIAYLLGNPRLSRVVGYAMSSCPYNDVPCHRILNRFGKLSKSFGIEGTEKQKIMLESEGIFVDKNNRVDLKKYIWKGE